jgi:hypothetical protein
MRVGKFPTAILLSQQDQSFSFVPPGDRDTRGTKLEYFKLLLATEPELDKFLSLVSGNERIVQTLRMSQEHGAERLEAMIATYIRGLVDLTWERIIKRDVARWGKPCTSRHWVLTYPAAFEKTASKDMMRNILEQRVGGDHCTLMTEREAAVRCVLYQEQSELWDCQMVSDHHGSPYPFLLPDTNPKCSQARMLTIE